ncbi:MAG: hypothetical protein N2645_06350 [Clostridia bacterium]|nr:hypothetical protein [Clostridia bacterium]
MNVFALFDDRSVESIKLEILHPSRKGERVDITYRSSIPDNIVESLDTGIKEAFVMLSKNIKNTPNKISIWFRGFEKTVQGNSTDLAFAMALIATYSESLFPGHAVLSKTIYTTGIIGKNGEIQRVNGVIDKLIGAFKSSQNYQNSIFLYPAENELEVTGFVCSNKLFEDALKKGEFLLRPVKTLSEALEVLDLIKKVKKKAVLLPRILLLGLCSVAGLVFIYSWKVVKKPEVTVKPTVTSNSTILPHKGFTGTEKPPQATAPQFTAGLSPNPSVTPNVPSLADGNKLRTDTPVILALKPTDIPIVKPTPANENLINEYNDGRIKFQYPGGWHFNRNSQDNTGLAWNKNIKIEVTYTSLVQLTGEPFIDTTLEGIYEKVSKSNSPYISILETQKYDHCITVIRDDYFNHIYTRGVGKNVPEVQIVVAYYNSQNNGFTYPLTPSQTDLQYLSNITEIIRKSIRVID